MNRLQNLKKINRGKAVCAASFFLGAMLSVDPNLLFTDGPNFGTGLCLLVCVFSAVYVIRQRDR